MAKKMMVANNAGGMGYQLTAKEELAKIACTGVIGGNYFYASGDQITKRAEELVRILLTMGEGDFVSKVAIYARQGGYMKDLPAFILGHLLDEEGYKAQFRTAFPLVVDNARMLRKLVEFRRSGSNKKNLNNALMRQIQKWIRARPADKLYFDSIGSKGIGLDKIIRLAHVRPKDEVQAAVMGRIIGREHDKNLLPDVIKEFDTFKASGGTPPKGIPFGLLTNFLKSKKDWVDLAKRASYNQTLQLLAAFARHGVFEDEGVVDLVANRLCDEAQIEKSKVMPYKLFTAYTYAKDLPTKIKTALMQAVSKVVVNVPNIPGEIYIALDVSSSMDSPVTAQRQYGTTVVSCRDVAALVASMFYARNPEGTTIVPFSDNVVNFNKKSYTTNVFEMATKLRKLPSGGTNCSAAMKHIADIASLTKPVTVIFVSDNMSWMDYQKANGYYAYGGIYGGMQKIFTTLCDKNYKARLILNDITPYSTVQGDLSHPNVMLVGGFSDIVFPVIADFALDGERDWVKIIEDSVSLTEIKKPEGDDAEGDIEELEV